MVHFIWVISFDIKIFVGYHSSDFFRVPKWWKVLRIPFPRNRRKGREFLGPMTSSLTFLSTKLWISWLGGLGGLPPG